VTTRREFIRNAALSTAFAATIPNPPHASPQAKTDPGPRRGIIDWHSHWVSPSEIRILAKRTRAPRIITDAGGRQLLERVTDATGSAAQPFPVWPAATDINARIRHLDEMGVQRQVISYTVPFGYDASITAEEIRPLFRGFNDDLAALVQKYPKSFLGLAALPTADTAWAARELERTHMELGFIGASLPLNAFATLRGAQVLAPIFEAAQRHRSHLLIHRGAASPGIPGQPPILLPEDTECGRRDHARAHEFSRPLSRRDGADRHAWRSDSLRDRTHPVRRGAQRCG
jgi:hypothetical protein